MLVVKVISRGLCRTYGARTNLLCLPRVAALGLESTMQTIRAHKTCQRDYERLDSGPIFDWRVNRELAILVPDEFFKNPDMHARKHGQYSVRIRLASAVLFCVGGPHPCVQGASSLDDRIC